MNANNPTRITRAFEHYRRMRQLDSRKKEQPMNESTNEQLAPEHDCGLCDGPLRFDGRDGDGIPGWTCTACGWQHTSRDCCCGFAVDEHGQPVTS